MKFMRSTAECSLLDHTRNEDILDEPNTDQVDKKSARYKQKMVKSCQKDGRH
jgi:hypothetical protein